MIINQYLISSIKLIIYPKIKIFIILFIHLMNQNTITIINHLINLISSVAIHLISLNYLFCLSSNSLYFLFFSLIISSIALFLCLSLSLISFSCFYSSSINIVLMFDSRNFLCFYYRASSRYSI